ncbi:rhizopine-binding protein [Trinickia dabaoshanensis]|uniref:Rhizopine-binding protein n=1 Tax=Trinickia dabaoshanensis TaxID=564714 RepID=A0A2N7VSE5_9BURK|nr:sugar ABC transporter substrate-binding protein [Trinickia dabaoshanensis]PMS20063.1 rhizopine-binding protein [Trinickia dabaoshanensis]
MKSIRLLNACLIALTVWAACGAGSAHAQNNEAAKPKIGIAMAEFDDNFPTLLREAMSKEARKQGWKPVFADGHSDQHRQDGEVAAMIANEHLDAIVILPVDSAATAAMTKTVRDAGVPLVYVNRKPAEPLADSMGYVGSQDVLAGRIQGDYVAQQLNGKGDVGVLVGQLSTDAAVARTAGLKEVLAHYPGMHVAAEEVGDWSREKGMAITAGWLAQGKKLDAIVSNNDEMAIGAIIALQKAGRAPNSIFIMGVDATPDALAQMDRGAMKATVYQDAKGQGIAAVDLAIAMKKGQPNPPRSVDVPFKLITPQNYKDLMAY